MASTRRFVCCVPGRSYPACSFEQELSVDVISRSLVLQNALAVVDDDCAAALVLPDGSDRTFFHAWLQYCEQAGWRGHEKTPEELVNALRAADFFADCEVCVVPMVVWRNHGVEPSADELEHMKAQLTAAGDARFGPGEWSLDDNMRQIPDHFHAHARDTDWFAQRATRPLSRFTGVGGERTERT